VTIERVLIIFVLILVAIFLCVRLGIFSNPFS
jgi:hypothetical protein